jgi:hypothetical protein
MSASIEAHHATPGLELGAETEREAEHGVATLVPPKFAYLDATQ